MEDPLYECEDCGIIRRVSELISGCPKCGQTMVPYVPRSRPAQNERERNATPLNKNE